MKIIVFGCGKVGATVISGLSGEGHDIVAIDKDQKEVEKITKQSLVLRLLILYSQFRGLYISFS